MKSKVHTLNEDAVYLTLIGFAPKLKKGEGAAIIRSMLTAQQASPLRKLTLLTKDGISTYKNINQTEDHLVSAAARTVVETGSLKGLITEHLVPMNVILSALIDLVVNDSLTMKTMKEVIYCGQVAYITATEAALMDSEYRQDMPEGWKVGDDPRLRADVVDIELFEI